MTLFFVPTVGHLGGRLPFGMIGASLSGVSFVSVPGMVRATDMTYMQMCTGFFFGYLVVAFVLLPLYYKLNLTSIYTYLDIRFGRRAYHTGASFFLLSKLLGAAARLYLVCLILQEYVLGVMGIPFWAMACGIVFLIWLYTFRSGIKALVWTDALPNILSDCRTFVDCRTVVPAERFLGFRSVGLYSGQSA